jgi:hypothetical protein
VSPPPAFHQITFQRGAIWEARFGTDGKSFLYSAAYGKGKGNPTEIYVSHADTPESRPFGIAATDILAVSSSGELAVLRSDGPGHRS